MKEKKTSLCSSAKYYGGERMAVDMELVVGTEDYEILQRYFESRKIDYPSDIEAIQDRIKNEYIPERWEDDEKYKVSNRQQTLRRISAILEEVPSNKQKSSISKT